MRDRCASWAACMDREWEAMNDTTEHSVVVAAGLNTPIGGPEQPWLFLRCEGCDWWLGYQPEMTVETLAAEAQLHVEFEAALSTRTDSKEQDR